MMGEEANPEHPPSDRPCNGLAGIRTPSNERSLQNSRWEVPWVKTSAGFWARGIHMTLMTLRVTNSCAHKCFTSKCRIFPDPTLERTPRAALLSQQLVIPKQKPNSSRGLLTPRPSATPATWATNSASPEESATLLWSLHVLDIKCAPKCTDRPLVLLRVSLHPAHSEICEHTKL